MINEKIKDPKKVAMGKKNKRDGAKFENLVRKDLESKGWIVAKWSNNVEFKKEPIEEEIDMGDYGDISGIGVLEGKNIPKGNRPINTGKLIPAKHKFCGMGRPMAIGTGFPDFIAFKYSSTENKNEPTCTFHNFRGNIEVKPYPYVMILGVECKTNGYLDKEEKEKCSWLLSQNIFAKIFIASKSKLKGKIEYKEYEKNEKV